MPIGDPGGPDSEVFFYFPQVEHDTAFGRYPHQNSDADCENGDGARENETFGCGHVSILEQMALACASEQSECHSCG